MALNKTKPRAGRALYGGMYGDSIGGGMIANLGGGQIAVLGDENMKSGVMDQSQYENYLQKEEAAQGGGWGGWGGSWTNAKGMKDGGVVRGCGKAERGRTRGRMR